MPVEDHAVHELVRIEQNKPYGCHNRDGFKEAYSAPQRRAGANGYQPTFWLERVRVPYTMSRECRYDMSINDPRCDGCKHRGSGEAYANKIRAASS